MRCPLRVRGSATAAALLAAAIAAAGCSSGDPAEAGAVGTSGTPLTVTLSQTYLSVENRTGVPIVEGEIQIVPRGVMPPFRTRLSRIEGSGRQDLMFNTFYSKDGTPFRRGVTRARSVRITAIDVTGRKIDQEVPFD
jgi:hypothetical protein